MAQVGTGRTTPLLWAAAALALGAALSCHDEPEGEPLAISEVMTDNDSAWLDEADDAANLAWVRGLYRDVYADTGGVPVPGEVNDGSYINYQDADLADPAWNTSGVSAHRLYYKDNYPRLQRVKARWDPRNVFRHALAIEPPRTD